MGMEGWKKIITSSRSMFFQSRTFLQEEACEYACIIDCVIKSVFKKKKSFVLPSLYTIWGISAYLLLLEESTGVAVS